MSPPEFAGLKALVTGGVSGIGPATARLPAVRGARVACLDLIPDDVPEPLIGIRADVADGASVRAAVDEVARLLDGIDVLVVNTCSVAATAGLPDRAPYSATKSAVLALPRATAADLVHSGIRENCVNPGTADAPWIGRLLDRAAAPEAERAALCARQPMGPLASADEVAAAVVHLASPSSGSTTGTALAVDGGMEGPRIRPRA
ncbi:SDR family oxidoreductase [Streptomyces sp. PA03-1a]|nr:SDR family oxidoreductase [Streptomyces sp. PA03-1a]MDX2818325.1 SDR family oxidoreductase [Streptomyces sp. PA03-5A]